MEILQSAGRGELQKVVEWLDGGGSVDAMRRPPPAEGLQRPEYTKASHGREPRVVQAFGLMHVAVACEQLEMLKMLLDRGASVDLRTSIGSTPLMTAAAAGYLDIVRELLKRGASVDALSSVGDTALMTAVITNHTSIVVVLLQHSANPDAQDIYGYTALKKAAYFGQEECVKALLRAKANTELLDNDGISALYGAEIKGHATIVELIRQHTSRSPPGLGVSLSAPLPSGWHWLVLWVLLGAIVRSTIVHTMRRTLTVGFREPRQSPAEQAAWVDVTMKELLAEGQGKGQVHSNTSKKKKKAGRSSAAPEAALSAATERAEAVLRAPSAGGGLGGGLPELELRRLVLELRQEATELRQEAEHKAKQEAAAEAAGLVAVARVRAVAAQREAVQIAAASKARKEAVAAAAAAAAAVLAAAVAAKADVLERETAGGVEGGSSEAASLSEASEVAVPDQYVCSITAEIMTDPAITVRLSTLDYPAACPACMPPRPFEASRHLSLCSLP